MSARNCWVGLLVLAFVCTAGMAAVAQDRDRDRTAIVLEAEEEGGNNLSVPVIWGEASEALPLRGTMFDATLAGEFTEIEGQPWYHQQDPGNEWQAENVVVAEGNQESIDWIDWGDNLEARAWTTKSVIRVETVLIKDLLIPMRGFEMAYISGLGPDEMWGTNDVLFDSYQATAYTGCANLTIQKIDDEVAEQYVWMTDDARWYLGGEAAQEVVNEPYTAEINVKGKVIYGYNWFARKDSAGAGVYRVTFSIDGSCNPGLVIDIDTLLVAFGEGEALILPRKPGAGGGGGGGGGGGQDPGEAPIGGTAVIDAVNGLTYIDVTLTEKSQGGKGGPPR